MRIFKSTWFSRFADKESIADESLKDAVNQLEAGQFDADLGGGVFKQRLARHKSGKSGGYRVLICFRQTERSFFMYGFSKSDRDNITQRERDDLKKMAKILFGISDEQLDQQVQTGTFQEIPNER